MARRPKIEVTAQHIADNLPGACMECAIATAINDAMGGEWHVCERDARDDGGFGPRRIRFTPRVMALMARLDRGEIVEPFSF